MTISLRGIGWLTPDGCGCIARGERFPACGAKDGDSFRKGLIAHPIRNFGRFDAITRMTCFGVALALRDAGISSGPSRKQELGIVGTSREGSLRTDIEYFRDYLAGGRTLSRGSLFIYTLPSSPFGEAAIHFGLQGPLLYIAAGGRSLVPLVDTASDMVLAGEARAMLAGMAAEDGSVFFVIGDGTAGAGGACCSLSEARDILEAAPDTAGALEKFIVRGARKA